ncbi:hypothetical protein JW930_06490 [Candidatus Woesearchaeota archaeon]|nr:hypothetical protein [Candidatus Woesearchaeota archaeon]
MRKKSGLLLIFALVLFSSCTYKQQDNIHPVINGHKEGVALMIATDKTLYHSNELINITISAISTQPLDNATFILRGIYSGYWRLDQTFLLTLEPDKMEKINVLYTTPACNRCSGISEGAYDINAELVKDSIVLANYTISVEIKQ